MSPDKSTGATCDSLPASVGGRSESAEAGRFPAQPLAASFKVPLKVNIVDEEMHSERFKKMRVKATEK